MRSREEQDPWKEGEEELQVYFTASFASSSRDKLFFELLLLLFEY